MNYTYEVREQPITTNPADRGTLIGVAAVPSRLPRRSEDTNLTTYEGLSRGGG